MTAAAGVAPREMGWTRVLLATAAFLLLARAPGPRAILPIVDTFYLLLPVLAACFVAGWAAGGPASLAAAWVLLTVALFVPSASAGSATYHDVTRAWGLLVGAAFGLVCITWAHWPLLRRAAVAIVVAMLGAVVFAGSAALSFGALARLFADEFAARNAAAAAMFAKWVPALSPRIPVAAEWAATKTEWLGEVSARFATPFVPALLVLEAFIACALAWALYHRLSRVRLGPPLASLRAFTFGQAPAWVMVLGGAVLLVPGARGTALAFLGANLVVLGAAFFALRGAAVAAWFLPLTRTIAQAAAVIAAILLAPITFPAVLGLGLTDGWLDWRGLARLTAASASSHD